jgi:ATP-dependent DNA ligase
MKEDVGENPIKFYCFDILKLDALDTPFEHRLRHLETLVLKDVVFLQHVVCNNWLEVQEHFAHNLNLDYEGSILRHPQSKYKFGRYTLKS